MMMRRLSGIRIAIACTAQAAACLLQAQSGALTLKIPPFKTALDLEGQPVSITTWGTVSAARVGVFRLAVTVDLGDVQEHLTPVLAAQLNESDRCGDRLAVVRAALAPAAPSSLLTATLHYERYVCVKALGKEIVKRLVGGNADVEVNLAPAVEANEIKLSVKVLKINADGSLGEVLRTGAFGKVLREKIASSIESNIQRVANRKTVLPPAIEGSAAIQTVQFADGGAGRLWLTIAGEARLSQMQMLEVTNEAVTEPHTK
jgi:hypothetical protein